MDKKKEKKVSKLMSCALRHKPEILSLIIDKNGWTNIDRLIDAINKRGIDLTREELDYVVENNSKKRFSIEGDKIRANQGHSIDVDLGLKRVVPPFELYHGTKEDTVPNIMRDGLLKMNRQHVHLSEDIETAKVVAGRRKGKNVILRIQARRMHNEGHTFYLSENGVWLTEHVGPEYISS